MAEHKVQIWRRTEPLIGDRGRIKNLERDEVTVEADSVDSALRQTVWAEYLEGGRRLRVYVRIDTPDNGHIGLGDSALTELANEEDRAVFARQRKQ